MEIIVFDRDENRIADLNPDSVTSPLVIEDDEGLMQFNFSYSLQEEDADTLAAGGNYVAFLDEVEGIWKEYVISNYTEDKQFIHVQTEHRYVELSTEAYVSWNTNGDNARLAMEYSVEGTRYEVGIVENTRALKRSIHMKNPLESLRYIEREWGGKLRFRVEISGSGEHLFFVDLLERLGEPTGVRFEIGHNLNDFDHTVDLRLVKTAMYGFGKGQEIEGEDAVGLDFSGIEWSVANGDPVDKPLGQNWVGFEDKRLIYGTPDGNGGRKHLYGEWQSQAETEEGLLWETYAKLLEASEPLVNVRANVVDLGRYSPEFKHEKVRLGDDSILDAEYEGRRLLATASIKRIERNPKDASQTVVELGNYLPLQSRRFAQLEEKVSDQESRQGIYERGQHINPDGTLNADKLKGYIDTALNEIRSSIGFTYQTPEGILILNDDKDTGNPTKAMLLGGGLFALANEKNADGTWKWRTFGDGDGFIADELIAGQIKTNLIEIFGNANFKWNGDNIYIIDPDDNQKQIRIGRYNGTEYGIGFTQDGGNNWNVALDFDGFHIHYTKVTGLTTELEGIESKADSAATVASNAETAADNANNKIDDLELGGRNLLTDSFLGRVEGTGGKVTQTDGENTKIIRVERTTTNTAFGFTTGSNDRTIKFRNGEPYAMSFLVRGNITALNYVYMMRQDGTNINFPSLNTITLSETEWTEVVFQREASFTTDQGYILIASRDPEIGKWFEVQEVMLNHSTKKGAWNPNPLDVGDKIEEVKETAEQIILKPAFALDFIDGTMEEVVITGGVGVVTADGKLRVTATSADSRVQFNFPDNLIGGLYEKVGFRIRYIQDQDTSGANPPTWDGHAFYATPASADGTYAGHGHTTSYYKSGIFEPAKDGAWTTVILDMHELTAGGTDWKDRTISNVRLDLWNYAVFEISYFTVATVSPNFATPAQVDMVSTRIDEVILDISPNNITQSVMSTTTFQEMIGSKADADSLANYATNDALAELEATIPDKVDEGLTKIDFSPFVQKSEWEQTNAALEAKFEGGGGVNLLRNSTALSGKDWWVTSNGANIGVTSSEELKQLGLGAAFFFPALSSGSTRAMSQQVYGIPNTPVTLSGYIKKTEVDSANHYATISIQELNTATGTYETKKSFQVNSPDITNGYEKILITHTPQVSQLQIYVSIGWGAQVTLAGMMLNLGTNAFQWTMANGELYNTNVGFDLNGIRVSQMSGGKEVNRTLMTPTKFGGYNDTNNDGTIDTSDNSVDEVFRMDRDQFIMKKAVVREEITMGTIKMIRVDGGGKRGISFVPNI